MGWRMEKATDIVFIMPDGSSTEIELVDHVPGIGTGVLKDGVLYRVRDIIFNCAEENPPTSFGWNVYLQEDDQQHRLP